MLIKESITLYDYRKSDWKDMHFKVKSLTNMVRFTVGQALMEQDVEVLIAQGVQVKIIDAPY